MKFKEKNQERLEKRIAVTDTFTYIDRELSVFWPKQSGVLFEELARLR
jgi:hypothetical protein